MFQTVNGPRFQEQAPDGSTVGPLLLTESASTGLVELPAGAVSRAVGPVPAEAVLAGGVGCRWRHELCDQEGTNFP
jgi:hypothetical protein